MALQARLEATLAKLAEAEAARDAAAAAAVLRAEDCETLRAARRDDKARICNEFMNKPVGHMYTLSTSLLVMNSLRSGPIVELRSFSPGRALKWRRPSWAMQSLLNE